MHNVEYRVYSEKVNKTKVLKELNSYVRQETIGEGGHGLNQDIRWLESAGIAKSRLEAQQEIEKRDRGWYDQLAVRFYSPITKSLEGNKTIVNLRQKENDAYTAFAAKNGVLYAQTRTTEFITCKSCKSALNRQRVKTNRCPVCCADLRPETTLNAIKAAKDKWEKAKKAVADYEQSHSKKEVMWLVKIEYHT